METDPDFLSPTLCSAAFPLDLGIAGWFYFFYFFEHLSHLDAFTTRGSVTGSPALLCARRGKETHSSE